MSNPSLAEIVSQGRIEVDCSYPSPRVCKDKGRDGWRETKDAELKQLAHGRLYAPSSALSISLSLLVSRGFVSI